MRIISTTLSRANRPCDEGGDQKSKIRIGSLEPECTNEFRQLRIFTLAEPLAAFRAKDTVICYVCSAISAKHVLHPVPGLKELQRLGFARSGLGFVIVHPTDEGRQTHQNGLGSPARLEAKYRAA